MDGGGGAGAHLQRPRNAGYVGECLEDAWEAEEVFPKQYTHRGILTREYALQNRCVEHIQGISNCPQA